MSTGIIDKKINITLSTSDIVKKIIELFEIPKDKIENGLFKVDNPWFYIKIKPGFYTHFYPNNTSSSVLYYFLGFYQLADDEICLLQIKFTNYDKEYKIVSNFPKKIKEEDCIKILENIVFNNDAILSTKIDSNIKWAIFDINNYIKLDEK